MTSLNNPYDEVPYTSHVFKFTHPEALATIATLFGLQPPPLANCRVLELGCASGTNLIAMAQACPDGEFVGIDLAHRQIQDGQAKLRELGMNNVILKQMSILDITPQLGKFDYIVAHGVFSWVPTQVQEKILQVCHANLVANGIAYISYNTYPGWYVHNTLREFLLYHIQQFPQTSLKLEQAKAALQLFELLLENQASPYRSLLKRSIDNLLTAQDYYLFHEHLERDNNPVFFHQFIARASQYGLHYLADTDVGSMFATNLTPALTNLLQPVDDQIRLEQLLDFATNRTFRRTLLCLQPVHHRVVHKAVTRLHFAAPLVALSATPDLREGIAQDFQLDSNPKWSSSSAMMKALCLSLGRAWPQSLSFSELQEQVNHLVAAHSPFTSLSFIHTPHSTNNTQNFLIQALLDLYMKNQVGFFLYPPPVTRIIKTRPLTTLLARWQARHEDSMTNLYGDHQSFGPGIAFLLSCLDGQQDHDALVKLILQQVETGQLEIVWSGNKFSFQIPQKSNKQTTPPPPGIGPAELRNLMNGFVDNTLSWLANKAFLVA